MLQDGRRFTYDLLEVGGAEAGQDALNRDELVALVNQVDTVTGVRSFIAAEVVPEPRLVLGLHDRPRVRSIRTRTDADRDEVWFDRELVGAEARITLLKRVVACRVRIGGDVGRRDFVLPLHVQHVVDALGRELSADLIAGEARITGHRRAG